MKLRIVGLLAGIIGVAAWVGACTVTQPKPGCPVAHGGFASKYTLTSGTGDCSQLKGEIVGIEKYNKPGTNDNTIALRANGLGALAVDRTDPNGANKINSVGKMASVTTADDFCEVTGLSVAKQDFPAIAQELDPDGGVTTPAQPALSIAYEWSDVRILVKPIAAGTQYTGNLKYTQDGCTANYKVIGLWPAIECTEDVNCDPNPDLDAGRTVGSGINPSFLQTCDKALGLCMLTQDPPALK